MLEKCTQPHPNYSRTIRCYSHHKDPNKIVFWKPIHSECFPKQNSPMLSQFLNKILLSIHPLKYSAQIHMHFSLIFKTKIRCQSWIFYEKRLFMYRLNFSVSKIDMRYNFQHNANVGNVDVENSDIFINTNGEIKRKLSTQYT